MDKKKLIAICIALLAVLLAFAFEWVVLWTYVGVGFAWCGIVMALTWYTLSFARGEQDRALKYAMVLGGVGMVMDVAASALIACMGMDAVAQGRADESDVLGKFLEFVPVLLSPVCSVAAIAMLPRLRLWVASVVARNLALMLLILILLIIFAPLLLAAIGLLGAFIARTFFLWVGFFIWLYAFYHLNCREKGSNGDGHKTPRAAVERRLNHRKKGSNKGKDIFIITPVFKFFTKILHLVIYIIDSVFKFFARIFHRVIRIFIDPDPDPEQRKKVQRRNVWALSLWGDIGRVEIVPSHNNTPWRMGPERYKRICSDVSAVDTVPFEITSPAHGAGEIWYIIPEGGTDFVVLLDKKPIRGKTPINAGNKVALWKRRKGTVIGRLEVKRRMLVETKRITSPRMKR